jgi:hypothetical protein
MRVSDSSVQGGAGEFHTTRWTLVLASARDQSQTGRAALAALCQMRAFVGIAETKPGDSYEQAAKALGIAVGTVKPFIHRLHKRYLAVVRQEVDRTVSDPAEIEGEIRALCDTLTAAEGRLKP